MSALTFSPTVYPPHTVSCRCHGCVYLAALLSSSWTYAVHRKYEHNYMMAKHFLIYWIIDTLLWVYRHFIFINFFELIKQWDHVLNLKPDKSVSIAVFSSNLWWWMINSALYICVNVWWLMLSNMQCILRSCYCP